MLSLVPPAFLAFLLTKLPSSHASTIKRSLAPAANFTLPGNWTYVGCYTDEQGDRTLSAANTYDASGMNATACISYCSGKKYVYAGLEYSSQCYCANVLANATTLESDSECNMACTGNAEQACGGSDLLTIYYANKAAPNGPQTNPGPAGWTSYGCWNDDQGVRTLANEVTVPGGGDNMTVVACTTACSAAGYKLAGLEYASQCFCANYVSSEATNTSLSKCNMVCNGNSSEFCGAGDYLNVYASGNTVPSAQSSSFLPAAPAGWSSLGCYNDSTGTRTLSYTAYLAAAMTVEVCTTACHKAGYTYAGLEYADECYCGNSVQNYAAPATDGRCDMSCNGNSTETCGGPNGLSLYQYTGWASVGCWNDTVGRRTLNYEQYGLPSMTVEVCQAACVKAGYTLAGLEYADECYCDNVAENYGGPASDGSAGCNMPCQGNSNEICGGSNRLSVWQYSESGSSSSVTSSSPTGTTAVGGGGTTKSTTTPTPIPSSSVNATAILPWKYQGCYTDSSPNGRTLANQLPDNSTLTVESCIAACTAQGYTIAGMEYSDQCFCDTYLRNSPALVSDSHCNMACAGDSAEMCGAGSILSLYANGSMTPYNAPTSQNSSLPGNWTYAGCLTDNADARTLPYRMVFPSNNSNTMCLSLCAEYGYGAGGTEYGQECYCGDEQNALDAGATFVSESECDMLCSDFDGQNGGYLCGGPSRLSYYTWTGVPLNSWEFATGNNAGLYKYLNDAPIIPLVTQTARNGKVTYLEKFGTEPANNSSGAYEFDPSQVGINSSLAWREMHVKTDIFCSASLTLPDKVGRQINVGGWALGSTFGVRLYWPDGSPGIAGTNDWQENGAEVALQRGRWYPTAMNMANGSILVIGGEVGSNGAPVPSLEVLPSPSGEVLYCDYLERTDPYNLYPYTVVLPSGRIFVAYYNEARILDPVTLNTTQVLPNIPGAVNDFLAGRTYPFEGTGMILPIYAPYDDYLRIIICGGSTPGPEIALDNCVTIAPDQPDANWTIERMPSQRVISSMVSLPDGTYLIINGAQQGVAGFGLATDPNYNSVLYDPTKPVNNRMTVMANTTIARLYHSEATLLDDATVLVSGSDPEDVRAFAPQEYRNEIWYPPYILNGAPRPAFNITNLDWSYGETITFPITKFGSGDVSSYRVSIMAAVGSTHGNSMGQRTIFPATTCSDSSCTVVAPPNANICPPMWHQVFLLDADNIPSNGSWVRIGGDPAQLGNWPNFPDFTIPGMGPVEPLIPGT